MYDYLLVKSLSIKQAQVGILMKRRNYVNFVNDLEKNFLGMLIARS